MAQGAPADPKLFSTVSQTSEKFALEDSLAKAVLLYIVSSLKKLQELLTTCKGNHPLLRYLSV